MVRLNPEQRHLMVDAIRRRIKKSLVSKVFGVGKIKPYKEWFNTKRYHRGIKDYPCKLFCVT